MTGPRFEPAVDGECVVIPPPPFTQPWSLTREPGPHWRVLTRHLADRAPDSLAGKYWRTLSEAKRAVRATYRRMAECR